MHPLLQKRLVEFLRNETPNQFVITTHSPALIAPQDDTAVIHLWLENGVTKSRQVETPAETLKVLHDLGVQASDLLQANSVIWVEGPSDRIYLNAWLRLLDPNLREDIDYSIMFYGGRLLSHLSMERDEATDDLVKLLHINQHSAILIDSDKNSKADELNKTKQRIRAECEKNGVQCWITSGREIENYLPKAAIAKSYNEITGVEPKLKFGEFDRLDKCLQKAYGDKWKSSWSYDDAKPAMARAISKHFTADNLDADLKSELAKLVVVIRHKITA
jgi:predicted ATP-dependent endonuclease of OLD family